MEANFGVWWGGKEEVGEGQSSEEVWSFQARGQDRQERV